MKLHFYQPEFAQLIDAYTLTNEQLQFTGAPKETIEWSNEDRHLYSIVAMDNEQLVTFFALHTCEGVKPFTTNDNAVLVRSFSTDFHHQGKGYAKNALMLLPEFIHNHFGGINEIVLGVNVKNTSAQALYKKCGYVDEGHRLMGRKGELMVMNYYLYSANLLLGK